MKLILTCLTFMFLHSGNYNGGCFSSSSGDSSPSVSVPCDHVPSEAHADVDIVVTLSATDVAAVIAAPQPLVAPAYTRAKLVSSDAEATAYLAQVVPATTLEKLASGEGRLRMRVNTLTFGEDRTPRPEPVQLYDEQRQSYETLALGHLEFDDTLVDGTSVKACGGPYYNRVWVPDAR